MFANKIRRHVSIFTFTIFSVCLLQSHSLQAREANQANTHKNLKHQTQTHSLKSGARSKGPVHFGPGPKSNANRAAIHFGPGPGGAASSKQIHFGPGPGGRVNAAEYLWPYTIR